MKIKTFKNEYAFLSNFYPCDIEYNGKIFNCTENAYQAQKNLNNQTWIDICSDKDSTPNKIKKLSKEIEVRDDWEDVKIQIMFDVLKLKFEKEPFKTNLIETKDLIIEEGNNWNDLFWGKSLSNGLGNNVLGQLLMIVRDIINNVETKMEIKLIGNKIIKLENK